MGIVLSLVSRKGGVSKTTLALNLAAVMGEDGLRVRLVDLDSQASLSQFFLGSEAVELLRPKHTVEALFDGATVESIEQPTRIPGVSLIPAGLRFKPDAVLAIPIRSAGIDVVLVDSPPDTNNPAVRSALLVSDFVLSPVVPEPFGLQSIASVQQLLGSVCMASNPRLSLLGYVVAMKQRLAVHSAVSELLRRIHGGQVFTTEIPSTAAFKEAAAAGKTLIEYQPRGQAANSLRALWQEAGERIAQSSKSAEKRRIA